MASSLITESTLSHTSHFRDTDKETRTLNPKTSDALRTARAIEQSTQPYKVDRPLDEYLFDFWGLLGGMKYVADHLPAKTVVELGMGNGVALQGLADLCEAQDIHLKFKGTGLRHSNQVAGLRARDIETRLTSFERMRGFEPNSVGAFLAYYSLPYVVNPERVTRVLDTLLFPGGFIKAIFPAETTTLMKQVHGNQSVWLGACSCKDFVESFQHRGYIVLRKQIVRYRVDLELLFALKPTPEKRRADLEVLAQQLGLESSFAVEEQVKQFRALAGTRTAKL